MARYKEYGYDIQNGKAIIPEWETEIKEGAFKDCEELTSVEFPQWIKKIGTRAFYGCSNLTFITLPESLTEIGEMVFYNCRLKSISIPPSVTEIKGGGGFGAVFYGCSSLTEVRIPKDCHVDEFAFEDCPNVQIIRY